MYFVHSRLWFLIYQKVDVFQEVMENIQPVQSVDGPRQSACRKISNALKIMMLTARSSREFETRSNQTKSFATFTAGCLIPQSVGNHQPILKRGTTLECAVCTPPEEAQAEHVCDSSRENGCARTAE